MYSLDMLRIDDSVRHIVDSDISVYIGLEGRCMCVLYIVKCFVDAFSFLFGFNKHKLELHVMSSWELLDRSAHCGQRHHIRDI